jgi:hypothetical protein
VPSRGEGNWRWRCGADSLRQDLAQKLATLVEVSDRLPEPLPATADEEWSA